MPPAWRFTALSAAWRRRCATPDDRGVTAAMDAFVDRAPIDWTALKSRLRASDDRTLVDALQAIDRVRGAARRAARAREAPPRRPAVALLIAVGALLTISSLVLAAPHAASASGRVTIAWLLGAAFAAGALLLGFGSAHDSRRVFLLGFLVCCASSFARAGLSALPAGPPPWPRFLWVEMFAPACLWQFALDFPRVDRFTRFDRAARRASVLVWTLGILSAAANLAVAASLVPETSVRAILPNHPDNLYWRAYTLATILAVAAIFVRAHRAPPGDRRKVVHLAAALAAGTGPLLVFGVARTAVPALDRWLRTAIAPRFWIDAVVIGALLATPILISAAVVFDRPFDSQQRVAHALRRLLRRGALWSGARHRRQLAAALTSLRGARGTREIGRIVSHAIAAGLGVPLVRVLVGGRDGFADCLGTSTSAPMDAAFVAMIRVSPAPLRLDPGSSISCVLPAREQRWLEDESIQLAVAITSRNRALAAIVVAGSPDGPTRFTRRDLWFVEAIAAAASAAWIDEPGTREVRSTDAAEPQAAFECPRCGIVSDETPIPCHCVTTPVLAALPTRLGGAYRVLRALGSGGMGVVYLGRDLRLDREVALKTLPAVAPDAIARLQREARTMASLNHEALATIYGLEVWRDVPVLVCEYFVNGTLARRLAASGPLTPAEAVRLATVLAHGLECMHASGMLHGDIKPANVGFTARGNPKLLDFGLSRLAVIDDGAPRRHTIAGTLAYVPPEALRGQAPAPSSDLWSLAVVVLECLVGGNPFVRETHAATERAILDADAAALTAPARALHPRLASWLERALAPLPERFESASAMRQSLERLSDEASGDHRE
jgi:hypothetical protein